MSWFGDNLKFEVFNGKNVISQVFKHPERALLGIPFDELGTKVYNKILGTHYDPLVNKFGGPTAKEYDAARAAGINTGPAQGAHRVADTVAGVFGLAGAGSALGGMAGGGGAAGAGGAAAAGDGAEIGAANALSDGTYAGANWSLMPSGGSTAGGGWQSLIGKLPMNLGQSHAARQTQMTPIWDPSQDLRQSSAQLSSAGQAPGFIPVAKPPPNPYQVGMMNMNQGL